LGPENLILRTAFFFGGKTVPCLPRRNSLSRMIYETIQGPILCPDRPPLFSPSAVPHEQEALIEEEARGCITTRRLNIDSLPEPERNNLIAGVTTEATAAILARPTADTIRLAEDIRI
jgi:hypothetical protein